MQQVLCFGDSNTWGLIPGTTRRYSWGVRWTSLLQSYLGDGYRIIEEGLCGRTTIFDDVYRDNRNGYQTLPLILESHSPIDLVILMLGTNDCKSLYKANAYQIAMGAGRCLEKILERVPKEKILLISPILLGEEVWRERYDPEFDQQSVETAKGLKEEYEALALRLGINFLAASDYAEPSREDQEHMSEEGHRKLAKAIWQELKNNQILFQDGLDKQEEIVYPKRG